MRIHAIKTGTVKIKTAQREATRPGAMGVAGIFADKNWTGWEPTYAWVIEHREGVIVVDTGQSRHLLDLAHTSLNPYVRWEVKFQIEPEEEIGPQLTGLGIAARDVKHVILTHLHIDHDAGLAHFPNSQIHVAQGEYDNARGMMGRLRGYLPQRWPSWFAPKALTLDDGPFGPFAASKRFTRDGDVIIVPTPGHTQNHVSVIVQDGDVSLFLAGDTSYDEALMLAGKVDGVSSNAAVTGATLANIRAFATQRPTVYLPTHDPLAGERFAHRTIVPLHKSIMKEA
jgi:N-acyl homoserine lactone hydrolase